MMTNKERLKMLEQNAKINLDNLNSGKISREQYDIRRHDGNNRITEIRKEMKK